MSSDAPSVQAYLDELAPRRKEIVSTIRELVVAHLPDGYEEAMRWGMISYEVPLARYPDTYNGQPLSYVGLASQKRYVSLYLNALYTDANRAASFEERWRATGKRFDMGKSCVRFTRLDAVPLELVAEVVASTPVDDFIERYEASGR